MKHIIKTKYIKTTLEAYQQYVKENGTDRVKKGVKLLIGNTYSRINKMYEIKFNPLETEFKTIKEIDENGFQQYAYGFKCYSGNAYRLDLDEINPENYWLDNKHFNISFTLLNRKDNKEYNEPTLIGELYEIFKRIMFIITQHKNHHNIIYVIGETFDRRKKLFYDDFIGNFKEIEIKIGESSQFPKGNETYYIKTKL